MIYPFKDNYAVTTEFGVYDVAYANYPNSRHSGTDYGLPANTPLYAGMDGVITIFDRDPSIKIGRGKEVRVAFGNTSLRTCHMNRVDVQNGQTVKQGQQIGLSGNTGFTSGPHVHVEVVINGNYVDPENHLKEEGMTAEEQAIYDVGKQAIRDKWSEQISGLASQLKANEEAIAVGKLAIKDDWQGQITGLLREKATLQKQVDSMGNSSAVDPDGQKWRDFQKLLKG